MLTQYIITTDSATDLNIQMRAALDAGCDWVEINATPAVSDADITATVNQFRPEMAEKNAVLIVADRYELVKELQVDGVHMRDRSVPLSKVRVALDAWPILGVSISKANDVHALRSSDIDYLFFEPALPSGLDTVTATAALLNEKIVDAPLVAAGGISADSAMKVIEAGANSLAIDSTIAPAGADLTEAIKTFINKFK